MFKSFLLAKRRADVTPGDFVAHYENSHAKTIAYMPGARFYKRNYIRPIASGIVEGGADSPYDVITQLHFDDRESFDRTFANAVKSGRRAEIAADGDKIFDRSAMGGFEVFEESETDLSKVNFVEPALDRGSQKGPTFKTMFLLKRRPGMSVREFVDYYENTHCKFVRYLPGACFYKRNFVKPIAEGVMAGAQEAQVDVVMQIWFNDRATFDHSFGRVVETGRHAEVAADEDRLFDRAHMHGFEVCQESETDLSKVSFVTY